MTVTSSTITNSTSKLTTAINRLRREKRVVGMTQIENAVIAVWSDGSCYMLEGLDWRQLPPVPAPEASKRP